MSREAGGDKREDKRKKRGGEETFQPSLDEFFFKTI